MPEIVFINPRFDVSYWGLEHAMSILGRKANMPPSALPLLAALTPPDFDVTIIDENVEAIDMSRCARADIVALTGMIVQRSRMKEIIAELRRHGARCIVVGGPWISVKEDYFQNDVDAIFVGEAEETWPKFLQEWQQGQWQRRYEQASRTDMTQVPRPRIDLIKAKHYMFGSLQFSRGCPFQCEFCDIIVTFGRRPRIKSVPQILAELDALLAQRIKLAFIVDDNLIGNKRDIKVVLRAVSEWQRERGYPMAFFTEASIDLADDAELVQLLAEINVVAVFIGIESPNEESLKETKKLQNLRQGGTLLGRVHSIQRAGLDVWCGMIVGFDNDRDSIFDLQRDFIRASRITSVMAGMLVAIPKTPLHERLEREGRLDVADHNAFGTNVIPLQMSREQMRDGYLKLMSELYDPDDYFNRLDEIFLTERMRFGNGVLAPYWRKHRWRMLHRQLRYSTMALGLFARLLLTVSDVKLRRLYRQRIVNLMCRRRDPGVQLYYVLKCAMHYHAHTMVRSFQTGRHDLVNSF